MIAKKYCNKCGQGMKRVESFISSRQIFAQIWNEGGPKLVAKRLKLTERSAITKASFLRQHGYKLKKFAAGWKGREPIVRPKIMDLIDLHRYLRS